MPLNFCSLFSFCCFFFFLSNRNIVLLLQKQYARRTTPFLRCEFIENRPTPRVVIRNSDHGIGVFYVINILRNFALSKDVFRLNREPTSFFFDRELRN